MVVAPSAVVAGVQGSPVTLLENVMPGRDFAKSCLAGYHVPGSYGSGDADKGRVRLSLRRGDRRAYRAGPGQAGLRVVIDRNAEQFLQALPVAAEWVTLDFSNRSLPERLTVTLSDDGQGWGEWLAVALKGKAANSPE